MKSSKRSEKETALLTVFFLGLFILSFSICICHGVDSSKISPYIDDYSTRLMQQYNVYPNDTIDLDVGIYNPINESLSVVVRISVENVDCFPSTETTVLLPPKDYSQALEKINFILIPRQAGKHPLEIQLW